MCVPLSAAGSVAWRPVEGSEKRSAAREARDVIELWSNSKISAASVAAILVCL